MRRRQKSCVPRCAAMSLRPLWPPRPPPNFRRRPRRQVELVVQHQHVGRRDAIEPRQRRHRLAGAVHEGLRHQQPDLIAACARQCREAGFALEFGAELAASRSHSQNPALCRVSACSAPGLPRPTMRRGAATENCKGICGVLPPPQTSSRTSSRPAWRAAAGAAPEPRGVVAAASSPRRQFGFGGAARHGDGRHHRILARCSTASTPFGRLSP
jgi:hypothetical protein